MMKISDDKEENTENVGNDVHANGTKTFWDFIWLYFIKSQPDSETSTEIADSKIAKHNGFSICASTIDALTFHDIL